MPSISSQSQTYLQKIESSKPVQFAKDNKLVTAGTLTGAAVIGKQVMDHSQVVKTIVQKGAIPTLGAGAIGFGGLMIHDALTNEDKSLGEKAKTAGDGLAIGLLGTEAIGHALDIQKLQPITQSAKFLANNKEAVGGIVATGAALTGIAFAVKSMANKGVNIENSAGLAASSVLAGGFTLGTASTLGASEAVMKVAEKGAGALVGTSLGVAAYAMGKEVVSSVQDGKSARAVGFGLGAAAAGITSAHLLGNASGIPALSNIAGKLVGKNPVLTGAIALTALGVGTYLAYDHK